MRKLPQYYKVLLQISRYYKVSLQYKKSTTPVLLCTTVLFCTTKHSYSVLQKVPIVMANSLRPMPGDCPVQQSKNPKRRKKIPLQYHQIRPQYYSVARASAVLQGTAPVLLRSITPVLLRTIKYRQYHLQCYSSTTQKILLQYYPVLQSITPVLLRSTKYYSGTIPFYKVPLRYYKVGLQYYFKIPLQYYKVRLQYYTVLQGTTSLWLKSCSSFLFFNFSRVLTARAHGAQPGELAEPMGKHGRNKETEDPNTSKSLTPLSRRFCTNPAATRMATHLCKMMNKNGANLPDNRWLKRALAWTAGRRRRIGRPTNTWDAQIQMYCRWRNLGEWRATAMQTEFWLTHMDSFIEFATPK